MKRALIVIDVQESFRQQPAWQTISNPEVAKQVDRLVQHARSNDDLVIWVLHSAPGTGGAFDPKVGFVRLIDGLEPIDHEPMMVKTSHNAFSTTNLQQILTAKGIGEVAICGIRTEQCCELTARLASDFGYKVVFVSDATATNPLEHPDAPAGRSIDEILADPRTLPVDQIIARTEYALARRFATISTVDAVTAA